jgi:N-acetylmuramoyl-L-alanine amidase
MVPSINADLKFQIVLSVLKDVQLLMFLKRITVLIIFLLFTGSSYASDVSGMRFWQDPEKTRLVFDVSDAVKYKLFTLDNPYRLVVDIEKANLRTDVSKIELPNQLVNKIRASQQKDKLRVVIDLKNGVTTKHFTLKPFQTFGHRLVVDLRDKDAKKEIIKTASSITQGRNRDIIIAIDAGHGGEDPGAPGGEKKVTLEVAKRLAKKLNSEKGIKAVLTRSGDYFVELLKRTEIARNYKADLFISLHADGFHDKRVSGAAVWVLNTRGANSEMGRWLEQKEKASDLAGGVDISHQDPLVAQVLLDLSMHYSVGASFNVGELVRKEIENKVPKMHGKGLKKANFSVLRMPDIPAMMVEMGFISNPKDNKLLKSAKYQNQIVKAIFKGVKTYFKSNPPDGSYFAAISKSRMHKVKSGDTLSQIAQLYGITTNNLKSHNNLKSNGLKIGQTLLIPRA